MKVKKRTDGTIGKALQVLEVVANAQNPLKFTKFSLFSEFLKELLIRAILNYCQKTQTYSTEILIVTLANNTWKNNSLETILLRNKIISPIISIKKIKNNIFS